MAIGRISAIQNRLAGVAVVSVFFHAFLWRKSWFRSPHCVVSARKWLALVGWSALSASLVSAAVADERPVLEEVVVSATKREQNLQDVPISLIAVNEKALQLRNITDVPSLGRIVPSFQFVDSGSVSGRYTAIRGVGTLAAGDGLEQSAGTVIDGVPIGRPYASFVDIVDVERVEVLRGPQGMLFGKNATAGLVHIITARPTDEYELRGRAHLGNNNERKLQVTANLPISESLALRASAWRFKRDGYIKGLLLDDDLNSQDELGARARLLWTPTDDFEILITGEWMESDNTCCSWVYSKGSALDPVTSDDSALGIVQDKSNRTSGANFASVNKNSIAAYTAEINYDVADYRITSITSTRTSEAFTDFDLDIGSSPIGLVNSSDSDMKQFTQELRISSPSDEVVSFVAGLFYYHLDLENVITQRADFGPLLGTPDVFLGRENSPIVDSRSYAAFGEATWTVRDDLRFITGLRLSRDELKGSFTRTIPPGDLPFGASSVPIDVTTDTEYDDFSWRAGFQYDVTDGSMVYATASTGYKGPGLGFANDFSLAQFDSNQGLVEPETVLSYEVGSKNTFHGGRTRLNLSAFHATYEDFQTTTFIPTVPLSIGILNAPEAVTKGAELELSMQPSEKWTLSANVAYIDAEFTDFPLGPCYPGQSPEQGCIDGVQDLTGKPLPNAPKWSYTLDASYYTPLPNSSLAAFVHANLFHRGAVESDVNNHPASRTDDINTVNLTIGVEEVEGRWTLSLILLNLLDEQYFGRQTGGTLAPDEATIHFPSIDAERRIGIAFDFRL